MTISEYLKINAKNNPSKIAYKCGEKEINFLDLFLKVEILSSSMQKKGIQNGSHVGVLLNNSLELILLFFAIAKVGAVIVPLNGSQNKQDLLKQIKLTNINYFFVWQGYFPNLKKIKIIKNKKIFIIGNKMKGYENFNNFFLKKDFNFKKNKNYNNFDYILGLTSGSTSKPKIIVFSQKTKILRAKNAAKLFNLSKNDKLIIGTPFKQSITQRLIFSSLILGATCIIMEKFTPKKWVSFVRNDNISFSILVSSQIENIASYLDKTKKKLISLKKLVSCCAQLNSYTIKKILPKLKGNLYDTYGATEVGTLTLSKVTLKKNKENMGKSSRGSKIIFFNNDKNRISRERGEICVKTKLIFSRYYKNEKLTKKSFIKGFFKTGDYGYQEKGDLYLTGRSSEVIITGGLNVYSRDIERIIDTHPDVVQSVAIGVQDKKLGEAIIVIVKTKKVIPRRNLHIFCANNLADYQQPFFIDFIKNFPTTGGYNKIDKLKLKSIYSNFNIRRRLKDTFS